MMIQNNDTSNYKHVFVCGLPRSGTSVIARNIGRLHNCTGLKNTGVLEDEGQYLQDVYPLGGECGGDGRFGFDPRMHLIETSTLLTPDNVTKLRESWRPYWDSSKTIHMEKSPANLLRTRFLQAAFPNSYFVVIRRHPVPVSIAIQKWKVNVTSLYNLFEHWLQCYDLFEEDKLFLKHVYELRYEDYVENPSKYHDEIAAFLGTRVPEPPSEDEFRTVTKLGIPSGLRVPERSMEQASGAYNRKYFDRWSDLLTNSPFRGYYRYIARKYQPRFAKYGYSLSKELGIDEDLIENANIPATLGTFYCRVADTTAMLQRFRIRVRCRVKQQVKAALPESVLVKIRQALAETKAGMLSS
jgi:Sulfotransferase family